MPGSGAQWLRGPGGGRLAVRGVPPATSFAPTLRLAHASARQLQLTHNNITHSLAHSLTFSPVVRKMIRSLALCVVVSLLCNPSATLVASAATTPADARSITSTQFCHGCKVTVEILGNLASKSIKRMEKAKVDSSKPLDMTALSAGLCSSQEYAEYESFVEDSCIKLLNDHRYHFLHAFAGQQSALFSAIKGNIFRAKKEACVNETNACPPQLFDVKPPPHKERTRCNACFELSKDVEAAKFSLKRPSNNARIIDNICENIASNHMPYSWIESHCDDIMDEYGGDIVTVLNRRDKLKLDPHASPFSKLVCRDMLSCSAPPWERTTDDEL